MRFPGRDGARRQSVWLLAGVIAVLAGIAGGALIAQRAGSAHTNAVAQYLPAHGLGDLPAPAFTLHDQDGVPVTLAALHGHTVLITFMDPQCTLMCPLVGKELSAVEQGLPAALMPELLVVSVAPNRTRADVEHFMTGVSWRPGWHWLLGTISDLAPVWAAYHVAVDATAADVAHDSLLEIVAPNGHIATEYAAPLPVAAVTASIESANSSR